MVTHELFIAKSCKFGALRPGLVMSTAQTSDVEWTARSVSVRNSENPSNGPVVCVIIGIIPK